ncbi:MAG: LptA/OstA family protein [bacterium]|nr:LptA/OstA family protein [bacterium]
MIITSDHVLWDKEEGITVLTGNVKVIKEEDEVYAKKMKIWGDFNDIKKITGYKDITIINKKGQSIITGDYFEYRKKEDYILIVGNAKLIAKKDKIEVTSQKMEKYFKKHLSIASNKVTIVSEDSKATGELLKFFEEKEKAILTGVPKLIQKDNAFSGEKIIFYTGEDKIEIRGNVKSVIYLEKESSKNE